MKTKYLVIGFIVALVVVAVYYAFVRKKAAIAQVEKKKNSKQTGCKRQFPVEKWQSRRACKEFAKVSQPNFRCKIRKISG